MLTSISSPITSAPDGHGSMRGAWATSLLLHGCLFVAINLLALVNAHSIQRQELAFADKVTEKQHQDQARARADDHKAAVEASKDRLAMDLADVVTASGQTPEGEQLLAGTDASLEDLFQNAADPDLQDFEQARLAALDKAESNAQDMLKQELVAQVRAYVRNEVAPQLKERIEHELETQSGTAIQQGLAQAAKDDATAHAAERATPAGAAARDHQLEAGARAAIDPKLREEIEKRIRDQAIPQTAEKVTTAVAGELEKAGLSKSDFQDFVKNDISKALDEELSGTVSTEAAWKGSHQQMGASDPQALHQAEGQVSDAAARLSALSGQQERLRTTNASGDQQGALAKDIADAESVARQALTNAKAASVTADQDIDKGMDPLRNHTASTAAHLAATAAHAGDRSQADHAMQDASQALKDDAAQMTKVASALAKEGQEGPMTGPAIDTAALTAALGKLQSVTGTGSHSVDTAAGAFQPGTVLGDPGKLARLKALTATVAQARKNAGEGRDLGNPSLFTAPGAGSAKIGKGKAHGHSAFASFNRAAYEAFVKQMRNRTHPNNAYAPVTAVTGLDSIADPEKGPFPAAVWAAALPEPTALGKGAVSPPVERTIPQPTFKTVAFGAAAMVDHPITVDGDLSDWGTLEHPMIAVWNAQDVSKPSLADGIKVYMRWSNEGLYFGYTVQDPGGIQPNVNQPYDGDCLEVFLDIENERLDTMQKSQFTHQFCFDPFGYKGDPSCTFIEIGRDQRGLKLFQAYPDKTGKRGRAAAKIIPGGYSVEAFVARETLSKPVLLPGAYLAVNFSVNTDYADKPNSQTQWSASKAMQTWNRPDTWGDVLLLGSDATLRARNADDTACTHIVPGQVLAVEVTDRDMNMDPHSEDRVIATVAAQGRDPVLMVLKETGPDTGVFKGSINTAYWLEEPAKNTVPVRPGDVVELTYDDPRGAYGEQHRQVAVSLPVAHPVVRLSSSTH